MRSARPVILALSLICSVLSFAQTNITANNKNLAYFNPAMQNVDYDHLYISGSYYLKPNTTEGDFTNYLAMAEFKASESFRIGIQSSTVNNRLSKLDLHKVFASYAFKTDDGGFFKLGMDIGMLQQLTRLEEFNKILAPTRYIFTDSVSKGVDLGLGMAYSNDHLTIGIGVNKLTGPKFVPFPTQQWTLRTTPDKAHIKHDTTIVIGKDDYEVSRINNYFHVIYRYNVSEKIELSHYFSMTNLSINRVDYAGLQNFISFDKKLCIGVGLFDNGELGYMGSLGYTFADKVCIEGNVFFIEEFNYDPNAANPDYRNSIDKIKIDAKGDYVSEGLKPTIECCLKITL